ncbi:MAG: hypothetical protein ACFE0Q_20285 [Anaerolineae bacterium]
MMRHFIALICCVVMGVGACQTAPLTATPDVSPTVTLTVAPRDLTALATYVRTLPPTFTPTFTPSATVPIPTATTTPTLTPTRIPEDDLCESFSLTSPFTNQAVALDELDSALQVFIPFESVTIVGSITHLDSGEVVDSGTLGGNYPWIFELNAENFPLEGDYEWVFALEDATRTNLCEQRGRFRIGDDIVTASPPAFSTPHLLATRTPNPFNAILPPR